ncbi:hypothetical protein SCA6_000749 [Theobroma cacao]
MQNAYCIISSILLIIGCSFPRILLLCSNASLIVIKKGVLMIDSQFDFLDCQKTTEDSLFIHRE